MAMQIRQSILPRSGYHRLAIGAAAFGMLATIVVGLAAFNQVVRQTYHDPHAFPFSAPEIIWLYITFFTRLLFERFGGSGELPVNQPTLALVQLFLSSIVNGVLLAAMAHLLFKFLGPKPDSNN